jgi:hypothetical protein
LERLNRQLSPKSFCAEMARRCAIPRSIEDNHLLFMGDSGSGKSSLIRQVLAQIAERGETAVVYDPALEYLGQFYSPGRGDVILNPRDPRMPYWSPSDEVTRPSEALTLAASLFQETDRENPFFVRGPRKIFAHLLNLKPTPEEWLGWLSDERELERRLKGTALAAMIYESAGPHRGGMFGSLSMVADSLRLLPDKVQLVKKFSVAEWAEHRQGRVFVTSIPEAREQLRPLISMWLDMMILRLMNQGRRGPRRFGLCWMNCPRCTGSRSCSRRSPKTGRRETPSCCAFRGEASWKAFTATRRKRCCRSRPPRFS